MHLLQKKEQNIHTIEHSTQWDRATKTKILPSFRSHCLLNSMALLYHVMKKPMHDEKICATIFTLLEKPSLLAADLTGGRLSLSITPVWLSFFSDLSAWLILVIHSCKQFENLPDLQTAWFFDKIILNQEKSQWETDVQFFYFMISTNKNTMCKECMNIKQTCRSSVISCSSDADKSWYVLMGFSLRRLLLIRNRKYLLLCLDRFILSFW